MCRIIKITGKEKENMSDKRINHLCLLGDGLEIYLGICKKIKKVSNGEFRYIDENGYSYLTCSAIERKQINFYKE